MSFGQYETQALEGTAMTFQEEKAFVEYAFQRMKERGWFSQTGLVPTGVTDGEIAAFEEEYQIKLPSLYKAFLQSYEINFHFCGICNEPDLYTCPHPLTLNTGMQELREAMEEFRRSAREYFSYSAGPEEFGKYLPIGLWDSDWLLWDLSKPADQVAADDPDFGVSWLLCSFAHDEAWDETYWKEGGCPVAPDFRTLLEWFFFGSLIPEFEAENHVKVTYQRLNNYEFLWHWYEDRWKED